MHHGLNSLVDRYLAVVQGGTNNPHRANVAADIREALLIEPAHGGKPAKYWSKEDQYIRLAAVYHKWSQHGGVWSAAAPQVRQALNTKLLVLLMPAVGAGTCKPNESCRERVLNTAASRRQV